MTAGDVKPQRAGPVGAAPQLLFLTSCWGSRSPSGCARHTGVSRPLTRSRFESEVGPRRAELYGRTVGEAGQPQHSDTAQTRLSPTRLK